MELGYASRLATAASDLHGEVGTEHAAEGVVDQALRLTAGECGAVTFTSARHRSTVMAASTPEAEKADQLQLEYGEGPAREAMTGGDTVVVDDAAADDRWPRWQDEILALGFHSAMSLRLGTSRASLGALSLYATDAGAFGPGAVDIGRLYASHASVAVASAKQNSGLRQAIDARHTIGQAQGMLMERHGLDAERAFACLRQHAHARKVSLSEYAATIISGRAH